MNLIYGKGFFLRKNLKVLDDICLLSKNEISKQVIESKKNTFVQFVPFEFGEVLLELSKLPKFKNILVRGEIYNQECYQSKLYFAIKTLIEKGDFSKFSEFEGDYSFAIETQDNLWIINSQCSQYEIFWRFDNEEILASNYHYYLTNKKNINDKSLSLLCYGENVNIYDNINILKRNSVVNINYKDKKCYIKNNFVKCKNIFNQNTGIDEIGETVHMELVNSVKQKTSDKGKCALMLSGGIDSGAIARCLYECNADAVFYTWSSSNKNVSEYQYSHKVAQKFGYEIVEIVLDEFPNNYSVCKNQSNKYPHTKSVSPWWEIAFEQAYKDNVKFFFSGHHGSILGQEKKMKQQSGLWHDYNLLSFIENHIKRNFSSIIPTQKNDRHIPRGCDIFSPQIKDIISKECVFRTFSRMSTDHYSYFINFCEKYNIYFEDAYLNSKILDIAFSLPQKYTSKEYGGFLINKIPLRYSMINKLPHEIVSRCYAANLDYISSKVFNDNYKSILGSFDTNSELVKRNIVDLSNVKLLLKSNDSFLLGKNQDSICIAYMIEEWLNRQV